MELLDFYKADNLWSYVTGEKDIPRTDGYIEYYRAARNFGRLCALTSLQKASSNPSHRPIDDEFVDIYNGITKAILAIIEMSKSDKTEKLRVKMDKIKVLAEYMGPLSVDIQSYQTGLSVVLEGDISSVYIPNEKEVTPEKSLQVVNHFSSALLGLCESYGMNETKKIVNKSNRYVKKNGKSK